MYSANIIDLGPKYYIFFSVWTCLWFICYFYC